MERSVNMRKYPNEILSLPVFHPEVCSREEAERYVTTYSQGLGSFIVRPSTENDPSYVSITISMPRDSVFNVRVFIERKGADYKYYIIETLKFSSFTDLLAHYREHRIHCMQGIDNLRLLKPLGKGNGRPQNWGSLNSVGEDSQLPTESLGSHDAHQGSINAGNISGRNKGRSNSEPQELLHNITITTVNEHKGSSRSQSLSRAGGSKQISSGSSEKSHNQNMSKGDIFSKYANSSSMKHDPKTLMKCRPPAPLPRCEGPSSSDNIDYYSFIETNKNFFDETYEFLKENDRCECGLRFKDSELPCGWTIHCSQDQPTLGHIFFQRGEIASWNIPVEVEGRLTTKQMEFIMYLCHKSQQPVPLCLRERLDRVLGRTRTISQPSILREAQVPSRKVLTSSNSLPNPVTDASTIRSAEGGEYETPETLLLHKAAKSKQSSPISRPGSLSSMALTIPTKVGSPTTAIGSSIPPGRSV